MKGLGPPPWRLCDFAGVIIGVRGLRDGQNGQERWLEFLRRYLRQPFSALPPTNLLNCPIVDSHALPFILQLSSGPNNGELTRRYPMAAIAPLLAMILILALVFRLAKWSAYRKT